MLGPPLFRYPHAPEPLHRREPSPRTAPLPLPVPVFMAHRARSPEPDYVYEPQAPLPGADVCPVDVSQADRYKYPACN